MDTEHTDVQPEQLISWQAFSKDFGAVLDALVKGLDTPSKAWQSLSRALNKYSSVGILSGSSGFPVGAELPLLVSACTALVLERYEFHQPGRLQQFGQLCRLTAHLYRLSMQAAGPTGPAVQLSLAKQAKNSKLLPALQKRMPPTWTGLVKSAHVAQAAAASAEAASARGKARKIAVAEGAHTAMTLDMELASSMLQLFAVINASWPGEAGLLSSQDAPSITVHAVCLAGAIMQALMTGSSSKIDPGAVQADLGSILDAVGPLTHQLYITMNRSQQSVAAQQLMNSSPLLQLHLMFVCLQLCSTHATADSCCVSCSTGAGSSSSDTSEGHKTAGGGSSSKCSASSSNNSTSMGSAAVLLTAAQLTACLRCACRRRLLSLLPPEAAYPGMMWSVWQTAAASAAAATDDITWQLQLLEKMLDNMRERTDDDWHRYGTSAVIEVRQSTMSASMTVVTAQHA